MRRGTRIWCTYTAQSNDQMMPETNAEISRRQNQWVGSDKRSGSVWNIQVILRDILRVIQCWFFVLLQGTVDDNPWPNVGCGTIKLSHAYGYFPGRCIRRLPVESPLEMHGSLLLILCQYTKPPHRAGKWYSPQTQWIRHRITYSLINRNWSQQNGM